LELEQRSQHFAAHAAALGEWDRHIRRNRHTLMGLEADLGRVQASQEAMEQQLDFIEVHQKGIHDGLESIESEAERMFQESRPTMHSQGGAGVQREELFAAAEELSLQLSHMGQQLREVVSKVNSQQAQFDTDNKDPLAQVTTVLNNQVNAAQMMDREADQFAERLNEILLSSTPQY